MSNFIRESKEFRDRFRENLKIRDSIENKEEREKFWEKFILGVRI